MRELFSKIESSRRRHVEQLVGGIFGSPTLRSFPGGARADTTATPTLTPSRSPSPASPPGSDPAERDSSRRLTEGQRQQAEQASQVENHGAQTAGMVLAVRSSRSDPIPPAIADGGPWPFNVDEVPNMVLITGEGIQLVRLSVDVAGRISSLSRGRWAEFAGERVHEQLFNAFELLNP